MRLADGRTVHTYDSGAIGATGSTVFWHHGSPQTGAPLEPLLDAAAERNMRMLSYGRPSYGGSSPQPGRTVAAAAADVAEIADAYGVARFAVMGASGGGPHALACAALLPERVTAVACIASLSPLTGAGSTEDMIDWFYGMASPEGLRAALGGREERSRYAQAEEFNPDSFTEADRKALAERWSSLGADVGRSEEFGPDGLIDDDVAFVVPWGFDPRQIAAPVLIVQGGEDRVVPPTHSMWLLNACPRGELWLRPHDGHISVLDACPVALDWLRANVETAEAGRL